jgi:hypothetical protein
MFTDSEWLLNTGTLTVVAEIFMSGSWSIFLVSRSIFISSRE